MSEGKRKSHIESWNNKTYKIQIIPHVSVWSKINTVKDFEDIFFGKSWFFVFFRPLVSLQYLFLTPECRQHRDWNGSKSYANPVIANLEFCVSFTKARHSKQKTSKLVKLKYFKKSEKIINDYHKQFLKSSSSSFCFINN